ncbi:hypothetical protein K7X08_021442 [Anisodus acutangulus]|uniref:Uncharacterized protein n=1 Tax=Anisodus acutangulus TaxID=402998 RepID=A0A9Q1M941_9SOLA|nr:hypothetical protein K7X08_021442 [Anisodus acutangulus]
MKVSTHSLCQLSNKTQMSASVPWFYLSRLAVFEDSAPFSILSSSMFSPLPSMTKDAMLYIQFLHALVSSNDYNLLEGLVLFVVAKSTVKGFPTTDAIENTASLAKTIGRKIKKAYPSNCNRSFCFWFEPRVPN